MRRLLCIGMLAVVFVSGCGSTAGNQKDSTIEGSGVGSTVGSAIEGSTIEESTTKSVIESQNESTSEKKTLAPAGLETVTPRQVLIAVRPCLEFVNDCLQENFGAEWDTKSGYYLAGFTSEEAFWNETETLFRPAVIFPSEEREKYAQNYYLDPSEAAYYPIHNFRTVIDVQLNMEQYMSREMVRKFYVNDFGEYEGALYMIRGAKGYGARSYDLDSLQFVEEKDGIYYVSVNQLLFDTVDYRVTLGFQRSGVNFQLVSEEH